AWQSTHISVRYLKKRRCEATISTVERLDRFAQYHAYPYPKDSSSTSGNTYSKSFPSAVRHCTQGGDTFQAQCITHFFVRGRDPKRHANAARRRLTNRWSARVRDRVPSSYSSARGAQLGR